MESFVMSWSDFIAYIMETGNLGIRIMFPVLAVAGILTAILPDANWHSRGSGTRILNPMMRTCI